MLSEKPTQQRSPQCYTGKEIWEQCLADQPIQQGGDTNVFPEFEKWGTKIYARAKYSEPARSLRSLTALWRAVMIKRKNQGMDLPAWYPVPSSQPQPIFEVQITTVELFKWNISNFLYRWLGLPKSLSSLALHGSTNKLELSFTSLTEEFKVFWGKDLLLYRDAAGRESSTLTAVKTGRKWWMQKVLCKAEAWHPFRLFSNQCSEQTARLKFLIQFFQPTLVPVKITTGLKLRNLLEVLAQLLSPYHPCLKVYQKCSSSQMLSRLHYFPSTLTQLTNVLLM